ncbi:MAG: Ig-like domain-containing protein [Planctomycetota bacterium]
MKTFAHNPFVRIAHKSIACILVFCIVNMPVWALNSSDATVVSGATLDTGAPTNTVSFDIAGEGIIEWSQMNVDITDAINTLEFTGTSGFAVLNRVAQQVNFNGALNAAGGHVFIVSPQGVIVGPDASITASAFTAAGLNIADGDFLGGIYKFQPFEGGVIGNVENYAVIDGVTDQVNLLGKIVLNEGTILLPEGGIVVMAAGETIYLGEPDSKVIVEMTDTEGGNVTNAGEINAPEGIVTLAAGDIYSIPIHPQLRVAEVDPDGNPILDGEGDPVYLADKQPVRVEIGSGTVEQSGTIHADGVDSDGGNVILTAGDSVYLRSGSLTTANGGTTTDGSVGANGGEVVAYAYDFDCLDATTVFENGAVIEAKGGDYGSALMPGDILQVDRGTTFNGGFAAINGNHIFFNGSIDTLPIVAPYTIEIPNPLDPAATIELPVYPDGGTLQIDPVTLTIANGDIPSGGAAMDTFYEEQVEQYSVAGMNLDLAADELITVEYMSDGEITGGTGDIMLRNVFDTGGIYFEKQDETDPTSPRTTMHTTAGFESGPGGNIFMIAGAGGIMAGDMKTDTLNSDKISNPGRIRLLTTNGGDMEVGSMIAERGNITEISAVSAGNLTVHGEVLSDNRVIDKDDKIIGFARICLVAKENVYVDAEGGAIEVVAHGKIASLGEIVICAGNDITIENLNKDGISATAQTSQNSPTTTSLTDVAISAGAEQDTPATIVINGITYDSTSDTLDFPIYTESKVSGVGESLRIDPANNETKTSENTWYQEAIEEGNYDLKISLVINDDQSLPMGDENSPCFRCPLPEGLPPVPHVFWILDDIVNVGNKTSANAISAENDLLINDDNGDPLADGIVSDYTDDIITANGGILTPVLDGDGNIIGFDYTPPVDATYVADADDPTIAYYIDSFSYKATDADGFESLNSATVTIKVKNNVPVANPDEYTGGHNVVLDVDGDPMADVITGVVPEFNGDYDIDEDSLTATLVDDVDYGTLVFNADGTFTYTPDAGNTSGADSFTYSVSDGYNSSDATTVTINLSNAAPVAQNDDYTNSHNLELDVTGDPIADVIAGVVPELNGDYDPDNVDGAIFEDTLTATLVDDVDYGTLVFNADGTFTYTPDTGNTTGADSFTYTVSDEYGGTSNTATVAITLTNADPVAQDDAYSNGHNLALDVTGDPIADVVTGVVPELNGDYDPDNVDGAIFEDTLTATLLDDVDYGTLVFNADGTFTYTPDAGNTTGADSFSYTVSDEYGGTSNTATVAITLTNADPVAQDDAYTNGHNLELDVTGDPIADVITGVVPVDNGDYDPDNVDGAIFEDTLTAVLVDDVDFGTLVFNADGTFTYTPDAGNMTGADSFTYTVSDQYGATSEVATVEIALTNANPIAQPDGYATEEGVPLVIEIPYDVISGVVPEINGDTDPDNVEGALFEDLLTAALVDGPDFGTLVFNPDGTFTYTQGEDYVPGDSFAYNVSDNYGGTSNTVSVKIKITRKPEPTPNIPVAPLPVLEIPVLSGCPAQMEAAAAELAVNSDQLQMMIQSAMASNPNLQPCDACEGLLTAAAILRQLENSPHLDALTKIFNDNGGSIDAPYTPEVKASVEMAIARSLELETQLAMLTNEKHEEYQQSAMANELVEAFVNYVSVLENDLKLPVGDSVALVVEKYFGSIEETGNPNISTFLIEQMEAARAVSEPLIASAD